MVWETACISSTNIRLSWTITSSSQDGFKIERKVGVGTYIELATTASNVSTYDDTQEITVDTVYSYRVRAFNSTESSGYSNEVSVTPTLELVAPTFLQGETISSNTIQLTWINNSFNIQGFKIERKIADTGTYQEINSIGATSASYSDTSVVYNNPYCYRVRSFNGSHFSDYSNEITVLAIKYGTPSQPGNVTVTASLNTAHITWTDNSDNEQAFKI